MDSSNELFSMDLLNDRVPKILEASNNKEMNLVTGDERQQKEKYENFCEEFTATLASKPLGYSDVNEIINDFRRDSGMDLNYVAQIYGKLSVEAFLNNSEGVEVQRGLDGKLLYLPRNTSLMHSKYRHIHDASEICQINLANREERLEREKLARANLPQNAENVMEGRRRLVQVVYELGGETKRISWQEIQTKYLEKYYTPLDSAELKQFFFRDKAKKILKTLCFGEFELSESPGANGMIFLRLLKSYRETVNVFEDIKRLQIESRRNRYKKSPQKPQQVGNYRPSKGSVFQDSPESHSKEYVSEDQKVSVSDAKFDVSRQKFNMNQHPNPSTSALLHDYQPIDWEENLTTCLMDKTNHAKPSKVHVGSNFSGKTIKTNDLDSKSIKSNRVVKNKYTSRVHHGKYTDSEIDTSSGSDCSGSESSESSSNEHIHQEHSTTTANVPAFGQFINSQDSVIGTSSSTVQSQSQPKLSSNYPSIETRPASVQGTSDGTERTGMIELGASICVSGRLNSERASRETSLDGRPLWNFCSICGYDLRTIPLPNFTYCSNCGLDLKKIFAA